MGHKSGKGFLTAEYAKYAEIVIKAEKRELDAGAAENIA
jgi:hypothetical protein